MKYLIYIVIASTLALSSCGGSKKVVIPKEEVTIPLPRPEWVKNRPISGAYYVGVGSSSKIQEPYDFQSIAKKNALNDLASEISVVIEGESFLSTLEQNYAFQEEFRSNIRTTTNEEIQDFEVLDTWENESEYWVHYRLSKAQHAALKKAKKDQALNAAFDYYQKGQSALNEANFPIAFDLHLRGLLEMQNYWGEVNQYITPEGSVYLEHEIFTSLKSMVDKLDIAYLDNVVRLNHQNDYRNDFPIAVMYEDITLSNMPLKYHYEKEGFWRAKITRTSREGTAIIPVENARKSQADNLLILGIEVESLVSEDLEESLIMPLVESFRQPEYEFPIVYELPSFYYSSEEYIENGTQSISRLVDRLSAEMSKQGFGISRDGQDAQFMVHIKSNTTKGGTSQGFHVAFLDMSVSVIDTQSGAEIFKRSYTKVKGLQLNFESAAIEAYKKGEKKIQNEVVKELIDRIL